MKTHIAITILALLANTVVLAQSSNDDYKAGLHAIIVYSDGGDTYPYFSEFSAGSPAKEAGIKVGDQLIQVDGKDFREMKPEDRFKAIGGEPGTEVLITVKRKGSDKLLKFKVVRKAFDTNSKRKRKSN